MYFNLLRLAVKYFKIKIIKIINVCNKRPTLLYSMLYSGKFFSVSLSFNSVLFITDIQQIIGLFRNLDSKLQSHRTWIFFKFLSIIHTKDRKFVNNKSRKLLLGFQYNCLMFKILGFTVMVLSRFFQIVKKLTFILSFVTSNYNLCRNS